MSVAKPVSANSSPSGMSGRTSIVDDLANDTSNRLYDDRDHFQSIFTNDSRFFDTSLHLFKSYAELGYISFGDEQNQHFELPNVTATSHGLRHRWKLRLLSLANGAQINHTPNGKLKGFLTPTLLKKNDHENRYLSDPKINQNGTNSHPQRPSVIVHYKNASIPTENNPTENESDEPDVIITRL